MTGRLGLLALLVAWALPSAALEVPISPAQVIASGADAVRAVELADLDGDGDLDALVGSFDDGALSWYANDGAGVFGAAQPIATAAGLAAVAAADLDRDGDLDVVRAAQAPEGLAWHANDGSGGFGAAQILSASQTRALALADLDGAGSPDVLAAAPGTSEIFWLANDGSGGFAPAQTLTTAASGASTVAAADLDRNGSLDVLWGAETAGIVSWHANDGGGSFGAAQPVSTSAAGVASVHAADLDQDGAPDVLVAERFGNAVTWHRNLDGAGNFGPEQLVDSLNFAASAVAADVDRDGDPDVVAAAKFSGVFWYQNDGAGGFGPGHAVTTGFTGASAVRVADLDRDGDPDLAVAFEFTDEVVWYANDDVATTASYSGSLTIASQDVSRDARAAADLDRDGLTDVIAGLFPAKGASPAELKWYRNDGAGGVPLGGVIAPLTRLPLALLAADLDQSGSADVLLVDAAGIRWFANDGSAGFAEQSGIVTAAEPTDLRIADLDLDGDPDLVAGFGDSSLAWYENLDGGGSFGAALPIAATLSGAPAIEVADWNRDGAPDLLAAGTAELLLLAGDGAGGFTEQSLLVASGDGLDVGDFDRDGDPDARRGTSWLENCAAPPCVVHPVPSAAHASDGSADLDRDGDLDLFGQGYWQENGDGQGSFAAPQGLFSASNFQGFELDLDRDGDLDQVGFSNPAVLTWRKSRSSVVAVLSNAASSVAYAEEGARFAAFTIAAVRLNGAGPPDTELASLELLLEEAPGDPLTSGEANALIAELEVYRDDGSGSFDAADPLVASYASLSLVDGHVSLALPDGDPLASLDPVREASWFVVVTLQADAGAQVPNSLAMRQVASGSRVERSDADLPVRIDPGLDRDLAVNVVSSLPDSDGDDIPDSIDGCPSLFNATPADNNGDGIYNSCQCGDANDNTTPDPNDLTTIWTCISGAADAALCAAKLAGGKAEANHNGAFDHNDLTRIFGVMSSPAADNHLLTCANRPEGTPTPCSLTMICVSTP